MIRNLTGLSVYQTPVDDKGDGGGAADDVKQAVDSAVDKGDDVKKDVNTDTGAQKTAEDKSTTDKGGDEKKKGIFLPKGRVDEMVGKERAKVAAAEARATALEAELAKSRKSAESEVATLEKQLDELEEKYTDAIADGEKGKALQLRKQMRAVQDKMIDARTDIKALAAKEGAKEEFAYNQALARFETDYDILNPEHEDFDEDLASDMADYISAKRGKGMSGVDALKAAVKRFLPEIKAAEGDAGKMRDDRGRFAREKAAEASKKQPADLRNAGKDHDKAGGGSDGKSILQMTQEEFAKLDEETKAKLRGDAL